MAIPRPHSCWPDSEDERSFDDHWRCTRLSHTDEVMPLVEAVTGLMEAEGYLRKDVFGMGLALEEALVNAIRHGNQNDPSKHVQVRYRVSQQRAMVDVEDEGQGFDPDSVPDPTAPENLRRPSGRGVFLMRHYTDEMRFSGRGNKVLLCKLPSSGPG